MSEHDVNIGIPAAQRKELAEALSRVMADTYTLYLMNHSFHWNVTGPQFQQLHATFMTQYTELWEALDDIAERIRALGEYAPSSYEQLAKLSSIRAPIDVPAARDMVARALDGYEAVARTAREVVPKAEKANDQVTLDLLTQRMQIHEKTAWMLRSMLD